MTAPAAATVNADGEYRSYPYPPTEELLDSVTAIIGGTNFKPWVPPWYSRTATAYCVDNIGTIARIKRTEGRDAAIKHGQGEAERIRNVAADVGTHLHDIAEALTLWAYSRGNTGANIALPTLPEHLAGALYRTGPDEYEPVEDIVDYMTDGFINWVAQFDPEFKATEMTVFNQPLGYAGTLDTIVELTGYAISIGTGLNGEDELVACPGNVLRGCVDYKSGRALSGTWKDQLAPYRRAPECLLKMGEMRPTPETDCGFVLHLRPKWEYPDCFAFYLVSASEDEEAWGRFQKRAVIYRGERLIKDRPGTSVRALRADGTMPGPRLCDLGGVGYGRGISPLRKALGPDAELTDLTMFAACELLSPSAGGSGFKGIGEKTIETARQMLADHGLHLAGEDPQTPIETPMAKAA